MSSPRLDDLQCAFASLKGFLRGSHPESISVHAVFDNEEVGSCTRQGADSTFLEDVLGRINSGLGRSRQELLQALASSFMISADNAHAVHPNQGEKADPVNRPLMNRGIVIKYHGGQKYTTDAVSAAVFKEICRRAEVPFQTFTNHSDIPGGSTLGNLSSSHVAVRTVDVGLPSWLCILPTRRPVFTIPGILSVRQRNSLAPAFGQERAAAAWTAGGKMCHVYKRSAD